MVLISIFEVMKNYHIIHAKFVPPTDTEGWKVRLYSPRFKSGVNVAVKYTEQDMSLEDIAGRYLVLAGHILVGQGQGPNGSFYLISETFERL
jgi:hypothetical protein